MSSSYRKTLMGSGSQEDTWLTYYASGLISPRVYAVATDSVGNVYSQVFAQRTSDNDRVAVLLKHDIQGNFIRGRSYHIPAGNNKSVSGLCIDSNDNVYCALTVADYNAVNYPIVLKYNSSGALQWQFRYPDNTNPSTMFLSPRGITVDSSDNLYISGYRQFGGMGGTFTAKINTSGTVIWSTSSVSSFDVRASFTDPATDDLYMSGQSVGTGYGCLAKLNSSGTFQWIRSLDGASNLAVSFNDVTVDSNGFVIVTGSHKDRQILAKYSASGNLQWKRDTFNLPTGDILVGNSVSTDSANNIYVGGARTANNNGNRTNAYVSAYNPSGQLQWSNELESPITSGVSVTFAVGVNGVNDLPLFGGFVPQVNGNQNYFVAQIDPDGGGTGFTYGPMDYQEVTVLTETNSLAVASTIPGFNVQPFTANRVALSRVDSNVSVTEDYYKLN